MSAVPVVIASLPSNRVINIFTEWLKLGIVSKIKQVVLIIGKVVYMLDRLRALLSRFGGALLGGLSYPLISLLSNGLIYGLLSIATIIGLPIFCAFVGGSMFESTWATVLGASAGVVVGLGISAVACGVFALITVFDICRLALTGVKDGLNHGFAHVFSNIKSPIASIRTPSSTVEEERYFTSFEYVTAALLSDLLEENNIGANEFDTMQDDAFARAQAESMNTAQPKLTNVTVNPTSLRVSQSSSETPLLNTREIIAAKRLAKDDESLSSQVVQYESLTERLKGTTCELVVYTDIETPILFVKQYKTKEGQWKAVPNATHLADKESMRHWLKGKAVHPVHNDKINEPPKYEGKETRYIWHDYKGYSQLQTQLAQEIRQVISVQPEIVPTDDVVSDLKYA
jgi:hypothetical protein